jgi:hypothetical protein
MIDRWKELWEEVRGPRPQWYERKDTQFYKEFRKNQRLINDKSKVLILFIIT